MSDLVDLTLKSFTDTLASDAPAPGGGSASAAAGAFGAGLLGMAVRLTLGKEKHRDAWEELSPVVHAADETRARLLELVDEDTHAFDGIVAARRLPKGTDEEKAARKAAIDRATLVATTTPMQTAEFAAKLLAHAPLVLEKGNPNCASDAWVAALLLHSAVEGALANVKINLPGVSDPEVSKGFQEEAAEIAAKAREALDLAREKAGGHLLLA